jgi:hypothetical protein
LEGRKDLEKIKGLDHVSKTWHSLFLDCSIQRRISQSKEIRLWFSDYTACCKVVIWVSPPEDEQGESELFFAEIILTESNEVGDLLRLNAIRARQMLNCYWRLLHLRPVNV